MKLSIVFDETKPESIMYYKNEVYISAKSSDRIQALLINEQQKLANLDFRKTNLKDIEEFELDDQEQKAEELSAISTIEKVLEKSLTLADFSTYEIKFANIKNLSHYERFLKNLTENIVIDVDHLSNDNIRYLKKIDFQNEPYVSYKLNMDLVSLSEFIETMEIIETMEETIARFSLSEIEQQMLLFDLIRERIYTLGNINDKSSSRDLSRVLKENEIVCAGYANIFAAVSNHLGIPTFVKQYVSKKDKNRGHATNVSYVYDSVYDIYFTLEYDLTWNSRKNEEDNTWINNYNFFAQPENIAEIQKEKMGYKTYSSLTKDLGDAYNRYIYFLRTVSILPCINHEIKKIIRIAIQIFEYYNQREKVEVLEVFLQGIHENSEIKFDYVHDLFHEIEKINKKAIPIDTFLKMLYRVRRIEHSINPKKYPLDFDLLEKIVGDKYGQDKLLLKIMLGKDQIENLDVLRYVPKNKKNKIKYDTKMMELLYQLRKLKTQKIEEKGLTNR